jgi:formylglycine-generating enzyme required for sulfatase activity
MVLIRIIPLLLLLVIQCGIFDNPPGKTKPYTGMKKINAAGKRFTMGDNTAANASDESPAFSCSFSYDFWIDTAEVTIRDYYQITAILPPEYQSVSDSTLPVCQVSWYDAVLYCNDYSKHLGLDTVYRYDAIEGSRISGVYGLSNLSIDLTVKGYRLPTEAEFEYALRAHASGTYFWGTTTDSATVSRYAWYLQNSGGNVQPVARLQPNSFGLYDMSGNALEWVNDVLGTYPLVPITDFAGSVNSANLQCPVKGGAATLDVTISGTVASPRDL